MTEREIDTGWMGWDAECERMAQWCESNAEQAVGASAKGIYLAEASHYRMMAKSPMYEALR